MTLQDSVLDDFFPCKCHVVQCKIIYSGLFFICLWSDYETNLNSRITTKDIYLFLIVILFF